MLCFHFVFSLTFSSFPRFTLYDSCISQSPLRHGGLLLLPPPLPSPLLCLLFFLLLHITFYLYLTFCLFQQPPVIKQVLQGALSVLSHEFHHEFCGLGMLVLITQTGEQGLKCLDTSVAGDSVLTVRSTEASELGNGGPNLGCSPLLKIT